MIAAKIKIGSFDNEFKNAAGVRGGDHRLGGLVGLDGDVAVVLVERRVVNAQTIGVVPDDVVVLHPAEELDSFRETESGNQIDQRLALGARQAFGGGVEVGLVLVEDARDEPAAAARQAHLLGAAIGGVDKASMARGGKRFAALSASEQHDFIDLLRQNKIDGWQGPPAGLTYFVLRSDAVDVVYGTMEGYESLGVPYLAHIAPDKRW